MRCAADCSRQLLPIPSAVKPKNKHDCLTEADRKALRCPLCGNRTRPHVLWFDEYYDETYYRYNSSIHAAENADALLVVGTSGATSLPMQVGSIAAQRGALMIDINPTSNPFSAMAQQSGGFFVKGTASDVLPEMAMWLAE